MCAAFKLSDGKTRRMHMGSLASLEEIKNQELRGYTHVVYEGESHFLYIEEEIDRFKLQYDLTLNDFEWFKEETGYKQWVLYNPKQFKIDRNLKGKKVLKFNAKKYEGGRLEMPINASSCCGMFSWCTLPDNIVFGKLFNTKNIKDMSLMFAGCIFPKKFSLDNHFDTSNVEDMRYMFYESTLPKEFKLNDKFFTSNVKTMEYMFSRCKIPSGFYLTDEFDTSKVMDLNHMFYESTLSSDFDFSKRFVFSPNADISCIFLGCSIGGEIIDDSNDNVDYVKNKLLE